MKRLVLSVLLLIPFILKAQLQPDNIATYDIHIYSLNAAIPGWDNKNQGVFILNSRGMYASYVQKLFKDKYSVFGSAQYFNAGNYLVSPWWQAGLGFNRNFDLQNDLKLIAGMNLSLNYKYPAYSFPPYYDLFPSVGCVLKYKDYYGGFSINHFFNSDSRLVKVYAPGNWTYYGQMGASFNLSDSLKVSPQVGLRYYSIFDRADADLNVSLKYLDKYKIAFGLRSQRLGVNHVLTLGADNILHHYGFYLSGIEYDQDLYSFNGHRFGIEGALAAKF